MSCKQQLSISQMDIPIKLFIRNNLIGPFYAGPNLTPALFTPALIPPVPKFGLTPFRAVFYATQRARKEKIDNGYFYALLRHLFYFFLKKTCHISSQLQLSRCFLHYLLHHPTALLWHLLRLFRLLPPP